MVRLKCSRETCNMTFKLLDDTKEYIYCPYCGKKVFNISDNIVSNTLNSNAGVFVKQLYQEQERSSTIKSNIDEAHFASFIDDIVNTIKYECKKNFSKHMIAGVYAHNIGDDTSSFINQLTKNQIPKSYVSDDSLYDRQTKHKRKRPFSYKIFDFTVISYDENKVLNALNTEIQKLGFSKYSLEFLHQEAMTLTGFTPFSSKCIYEKNGTSRTLLYITLEW